MNKSFELTACTAVRRRSVPIILAGLACLSLASSAWAVDPNPLQNAYWRFEEGAAGTKVAAGDNTVIDSANQTEPNHMQTLDANTGPLYTSVVPTSVIPRTGALNTRSLRFTPNQDIYTRGGDPAPVGKHINHPIINNGFTLEAAFMPAALGRWQVIVGKDGKPNGGGRLEQTLALKVNAGTNHLYVELFDASNTYHAVESLAPLVAYRWYYAAVVNDGSALSLWLDRNDGNGYVLQGRDLTLAGALFQNDTSWAIGRGMFDGGITDWFDGYIDEVRLSNTVLAPADFLFTDPAKVTITYVDANPDPAKGDVNVTVQGNAIADGTNFELGETEVEADEGVWSERYFAVNGGSVLVSKDAVDATDDGNGILWTSTPTLAAGSYYLYLFFWTNQNGGGLWDCRAAIGELSNMAGMTTYTFENTTNLAGKSQLDGFGLPAGLVTVSDTQNLLAVPIGVATLGADGPITVSTAGVQQPTDCRGADQRTWFDGIGYRPVEPRSIPKLIYVDATPNTNGTDGNTTVDGALVTFGDNVTGSCTNDAEGPGDDNKWNWRGYRVTAGNQANGFNVWEANWDEIPAPLVTTLNLEPGTYNLYGLFWWSGCCDWAYMDWDAGFRVGPEGDFVTFGRQNTVPAVADGSQFANYVLTRSGVFDLRIAPLGRHTVSGPVQIYAGAPRVWGAWDERTFYDGVAYERVDADAPSALPVSDGFGDGDRDNDGSPEGAVDDAGDVGLKWYRAYMGVPPNHNLGIAHDSDGLGDDNALRITDAAPHAYQVANFPGVMLSHPNDYIRLTFNVRLPAPLVDFGDTFRFGLFSDAGTPVLADEPTGEVLSDDPGYIIAYATGTCSPTGWFSIGYPANTLALPHNPDPLFGQDAIIFDPVPSFDGNIRDTNPHEISLTITRQADGSAEIAVGMDTGVKSRALWAATNLPVLSFNQVAFGNSPAPVGTYGSCPEWTGLDYIIDDVRIEADVYIPPCLRPLWADMDKDTDVDQDDFGEFQRCFLVPLGQDGEDPCTCFNVTGPGGEKDNQVDSYDLDAFTACQSVPNVASVCMPQ